MKSSEIANEISELRLQQESIKRQLAELIKTSQAYLVSTSILWINTAVQRAIANNPETFTKLGAERIRSLKDATQNVIASTPETVEREMSDETKWPHNSPDDPYAYSTGSKEPFFAKTFRNVISRIASVLNEYGLLTEPDGHVRSWEKVGAGKSFRYAFNPGFETGNSADIIEYNKLHVRYHTLGKTIIAKMKEKAQSEAQELWDNT